MTVSDFRPLFNEVWKGYPEDVKKVAWMACFRRTRSRKNGNLSERAVQIYRILKALKPVQQ